MCRNWENLILQITQKDADADGQCKNIQAFSRLGGGIISSCNSSEKKKEIEILVLLLLPYKIYLLTL